jgi:hypothetical protein
MFHRSRILATGAWDCNLPALDPASRNSPPAGYYRRDGGGVIGTRAILGGRRLSTGKGGFMQMLGGLNAWTMPAAVGQEVSAKRI